MVGGCVVPRVALFAGELGSSRCARIRAVAFFDPEGDRFVVDEDTRERWRGFRCGFGVLAAGAWRLFGFVRWRWDCQRPAESFGGADQAVGEAERAIERSGGHLHVDQGSDTLARGKGQHRAVGMLVVRGGATDRGACFGQGTRGGDREAGDAVTQ